MPSAHLDDIALGGVTNVVEESESEDKDGVDIDENDLRDDHFEVDFASMPCCAQNGHQKLCLTPTYWTGR